MCLDTQAFSLCLLPAWPMHLAGPLTSPQQQALSACGQDTGVRQHSCKALEQLSPWLKHRRTHLIAARLAYPMTVSNCQVKAPAEATAETLAVASRASRHSCASPCQPGQRQANDTRGADILRRCGLPTKPRAPSADGMLCMLCELGKHYCWALPAQAQTNGSCQRRARPQGGVV